MKKISILSVLAATSLFVAAQQSVKSAAPQAAQPVATITKPAAQPAPQTADPADAPVITFAEKTHDFGKVAFGEAVYTFEFTNTGKSPLMVTNAAPSCGCTVADYTKSPVEPGQKGYVTANFKQTGVFNKTVTVTSNSTTPSVVLTIKGEVIPKPAAVPTAEATEISKK